VGRAQRALHHGFHGYIAGVLGLVQLGILVHQPRQERLIERAPVHADAYRLVVLDGDFDHGAEVVVVLLADRTVAGVDAVLGQRPRAFGILLQQDVAVVVEVADDGYRDAEAVQPVNNIRHGSRGVVVIDGNAHQFGAGAGQSGALADGAVNVGGVGVGHGLHHNWCIAADADRANRGRISLSALNLSHNQEVRQVYHAGGGFPPAFEFPGYWEAKREIQRLNEMELRTRESRKSSQAFDFGWTLRVGRPTIQVH